MLVNFCNPNQLIVAIQIDENVITCFFREFSPVILQALGIYFQTAYEKMNTQIFTVRGGQNHTRDFHSMSSHMSKMSHWHVIFEKKIDVPMLKQFITLLEKYQDKDANLRYLYEEQARPTIKPKSLLGKLRAWYYGDGINPDLLPFLSSRNIKRIQDKFINIKSAKDFRFSSRDVINIYKNRTDEHTFPLHTAVFKPADLQNVTCNQINSIAANYQPSQNTELQVIAVLALVLTAGYQFFKPCPPQVQALENANARPVHNL
jgi:hypothetical protein